MSVNHVTAFDAEFHCGNWALSRNGAGLQADYIAVSIEVGPVASTDPTYGTGVRYRIDGHLVDREDFALIIEMLRGGH
jgi:hypothetical protein